jgi:hypothetical protein
VLRALFIALVISVLAQSAAPIASQPPEECLASCADDSPAGECAPLCIDCTCCSHALRAPMAAANAPLAPTPFFQPARSADWLARVPARPAHDVFHVPKLRLA